MVSSVSQAQTWEVYLKQQMDHSFAALDNKIAYCHNHRQPLAKITDDWFIKLSKNEKFVATNYLYWLASQDCWKPELLRYQANVLAYTAESNDKKALNKWLELSGVYTTQNLEKTFKQMDITRLITWYQSHAKLVPFNEVEFLEQYPEFSRGPK